MALILCPECGKEISDTARKCPNCGYALKKVNTGKLLAVAGAVLAAIAVLAAAYYFFVYTPGQIPAKAAALLEKGDYKGADALYARLGRSEENLKLREQLYYESRIVSAAKAMQDNLIFPDTMMISEVIIWDDEVLDDGASSDTKEVYVATEPEILLHYLAKAKGGSMVDGFVRVIWKGDRYVAGTAVSDLETGDSLPWYIDEGTEEALEFWQENLVKARINMDLLTRRSIGEYDLQRCNDVLAATFNKPVEIVPAGNLIVTPSPRIVKVTPKP